MKALRSADLSFEKAELKLKVAELAEALATARLSVLDAQEEIRNLHARIAELTAVQDMRSRIVQRENVYFIQDGETEKGPYCPRCFEVENSLILAAKLPNTFRNLGTYKCPHCKAVY